MVGGGGEQLLLRVVAKHADLWNLSNADAPTFRHKLNVLKGHCSEVNRNLSDITNTLDAKIAISYNAEDAISLAKESPFVQKLTDAYLIDNPERIEEMIKDYVDSGVKLFVLRFLDFPNLEGLELFKEKVIHSFK
jgi:alkanesulfonate monooxygenase SsuD/methylene tetrahydromethanopterin reductase-like flavin-dependent oxidoreductase (luciferase family)